MPSYALTGTHRQNYKLLVSLVTKQEGKIKPYLNNRGEGRYPAYISMVGNTLRTNKIAKKRRGAREMAGEMAQCL